LKVSFPFVTSRRSEASSSLSLRISSLILSRVSKRFQRLERGRVKTFAFSRFGFFFDTSFALAASNDEKAGAGDCGGDSKPDVTVEPPWME
jgi:hypothetical protein